MSQTKAVILSAGQGKRLSPLTDDKPKCLIELSGRTVLHWQLANLHAVGVREAVVVTGFGAACGVEQEVGDLRHCGNDGQDGAARSFRGDEIAGGLHALGGADTGAAEFHD